MNAYEAGSLGAVVGSASSRTMTYISDQYGQVLRRNKTQANGNLEVAHRFYYMNGHTIGDVSSEGPSTISYAEELAQRGLTTPGGFRNAKPVSSADFDQNYQPINSSYPGATASAYTVRKGDTLGAIARAVWGDESLWYLLADANGLTISDTLIEGQVLAVPNKVSNFHNNASTFKVYNAGQAIGDTMPVLPPEPMPPPPPQQSKGGGCGVMGKLIMVVVAVAVTYMSMGAATGVAASIFGAGTTAATVAAGAIAGAVGSVASQTVGMAIGAQDGFNWNGVALGALGGAATAGVMNTGMGPTFSPGTSAFVKGAVQGGISNTITQGVAVATGLQHSFDWRGVAAGAIAGGVFAEVGNAIGQAQYGEQGWANLNGLAQDAKDAALWSDIGKTMARGAASGVAAGMASGLVRGGSLRNSLPGIMQDVIASTVGNAIGLGAQVTQRMAESVATDAFGNALGNSLAYQGSSSREQKFAAMDARVDEVMGDVLANGERVASNAPMESSTQSMASGWRKHEVAQDGTVIYENLDSADSQRFKAIRDFEGGDWPTIEGHSPSELKVISGLEIQTQWEQFYSENVATSVSPLSDDGSSVNAFVRDLDTKYKAGTLQMLSELGNVWRQDDSGTNKVAKSLEWFTYQHPEGMNYGNKPTTAPNLRATTFDNMLRSPIAAMVGGYMASRGRSEVDIYHATQATGAAEGVLTSLAGFGGQRTAILPRINPIESGSNVGLRGDLAKQAGIPTRIDLSNPNNVWGLDGQQLLSHYRTKGYDGKWQPAKGSGLAQVFSLEGHSDIGFVQFHPGGGTAHRGSYYKFGMRDGSEVKVIDPSTYLARTPKQGTVFFNPNGEEIILMNGRWTPVEN